MPAASKLTPLFYSLRMDWETPQAFFDMLNARFRFNTDAAADAQNAKCKRFWSREDSALDRIWSKHRIWCNPPYGKELPPFIDKAIAEMAREVPPSVIVMLVPSRTDTRWWHRATDSGCRVEFIKGRLKFQGAASSAPFPSALLIWGE